MKVSLRYEVAENPGEIELRPGETLESVSVRVGGGFSCVISKYHRSTDEEEWATNDRH